ncbi:hypothetical protein DFH06DRAFT_570966 [Mycena polygramma]|nr:hypothetical protein DFH06DRAFT_570966 [Mycena polygramma]
MGKAISKILPCRPSKEQIDPVKRPPSSPSQAEPPPLAKPVGRPLAESVNIPPAEPVGAEQVEPHPVSSPEDEMKDTPSNGVLNDKSLQNDQMNAETSSNGVFNVESPQPSHTTEASPPNVEASPSNGKGTVFALIIGIDQYHDPYNFPICGEPLTTRETSRSTSSIRRMTEGFTFRPTIYAASRMGKPPEKAFCPPSNLTS